MDRTPDIILYNIRKTNNTEKDFRQFIKELDLGSPIAILELTESNKSNQHMASNAFLRLHDTKLHTKAATILNGMKSLDYKLIAFINHKVWNNELSKFIPAKQHQFLEAQQQQQNQNQQHNQHQNQQQLQQEEQQEQQPEQQIQQKQQPHYNFACQDIRQQFKDTPIRVINNQQLNTVTETEEQPQTSNSVTRTIITKTTTYTIETTTTAINNKCQYCDKIPAFGRGKLFLQLHESQCQKQNQIEKQ